MANMRESRSRKGCPEIAIFSRITKISPAMFFNILSSLTLPHSIDIICFTFYLKSIFARLQRVNVAAIPRRENKVNQVITARVNKDLCTLQDERYYGNPSFAIDRPWYQEKFPL